MFSCIGSVSQEEQSEQRHGWPATAVVHRDQQNVVKRSSLPDAPIASSRKLAFNGSRPSLVA